METLREERVRKKSRKSLGPLPSKSRLQFAFGSRILPPVQDKENISINMMGSKNQMLTLPEKKDEKPTTIMKNRIKRRMSVSHTQPINAPPRPLGTHTTSSSSTSTTNSTKAMTEKRIPRSNKPAVVSSKRHPLSATTTSTTTAGPTTSTTTTTTTTTSLDQKLSQVQAVKNLFPHKKLFESVDFGYDKRSGQMNLNAAKNMVQKAVDDLDILEQRILQLTS